MIGLKKTSLSSSLAASPVTLNARKSNLYDPLGIFVPFANVGVVKVNELEPLSAGSCNEAKKQKKQKPSAQIVICLELKKNKLNLVISA